MRIEARPGSAKEVHQPHPPALAHHAVTTDVRRHSLNFVLSPYPLQMKAARAAEAVRAARTLDHRLM